MTPPNGKWRTLPPNIIFHVISELEGIVRIRVQNIILPRIEKESGTRVLHCRPSRMVELEL